ncbi:hypothetical protein LRS06_15275 [Hymenobacter sp. J193]|uniref:hypothetical protein n=1 Tax=Hymenobacter sp. J193 TaxID=2898429 RepID=UPI00215194AF|nr:hypothetical protein [Hymenobacter sp. J193]MCR5889103.1 hypothetical protein [Hymenobacter sp. J193]
MSIPVIQRTCALPIWKNLVGQPARLFYPFRSKRAAKVTTFLLLARFPKKKFFSFGFLLFSNTPFRLKRAAKVITLNRLLQVSTKINFCVILLSSAARFALGGQRYETCIRFCNPAGKLFSIPELHPMNSRSQPYIGLFLRLPEEMPCRVPVWECKSAASVSLFQILFTEKHLEHCLNLVAAFEAHC